MISVETLSGEFIDLLFTLINNRLKIANDKHKWKELFIDTGKSVSDEVNIAEECCEELCSIFSNENMKRIAKNTENISGYELIKILHEQLYGLMIQYDIPESTAQCYIHNFNQNIIQYLKENDSQKMLEVFLNEWKRKDDDRYLEIVYRLVEISKQIRHLKSKKINLLSINDIDTRIRKRATYKGMSLEFFEIDDEEFEIKFQNCLKNEKISVIGNSREETLYRLLNELKILNLDHKTYVVESEEEWCLLENENLLDKILIPYFIAETIPVISNNTNIFIYGVSNPCYDKNKILLRKRTRRNIINSLEKYMDYHDAYMIVENTHGLYASMKKKIFNEANYNCSKWVAQHTNAVMAALLCGQWKESTDDEKIFEKLSNESYEKSKKELMKYMYGENSFLIEIKNYSDNTMHLVSVEDAWQELDLYITDGLWEKFLNLFFEVMIVSDYEGTSDCLHATQVMKKSMIRTLMMRVYCCNHDENQKQVDYIVKKIFGEIDSLNNWGYIARYMADLCEVSPEVILEKIENELNQSTGMLELFQNNNKYELGYGNYAYIFLAIEYLLQQKKYVKRVIDWLWKINSYSKKYEFVSNPKDILDIVFCAWVNEVPLTVEEKISYAKDAIEMPNAEQVIFSKLPKGGGATCMALSTPKYREVDEPIEFSNEDVGMMHIEYLKMCVEIAKNNTERWKIIIDALYHYDTEIQKKVLFKLGESTNRMNDKDKIVIKLKIRETIYRHRYYANTYWSMTTENIALYEELLNRIIVKNPMYDYVYLFENQYDFKLLNPEPYTKNSNGTDRRKNNEFLRKKEIENSFNEFKKKGYSINELIDLVINNDKLCIGETLAEFYCNLEYDEDVFNILIRKDKSQNEVLEYLKCLIYKKKINVAKAIEIAKQKKLDKNVIVGLLKIESLNNNIKNLLAHEDSELKKMYWGTNIYIHDHDEYEIYLWAIKECQKYGTMCSYINLLYDLKNLLKNEDLYLGLIGLNQMKRGKGISSYSLSEILKILQKRYIDDNKRCYEISKIEWEFNDILEWDDMKCVQHIMKFDPLRYADLIKNIYNSDDGETSTKKQISVNDLYSIFYKIHFCPCELNGRVNYKNLESWVKKFKELLAQNRQEKLFGSMIGRLLPFSPVGEDGLMPCEAVRRIIEKYHCEELNRAYCITECNKRGVYTATAGKKENEMANEYRNNAESLQKKYPFTAKIYFDISNSYKAQSEYERRRAEDEF